jgi:hypothetical protein
MKDDECCERVRGSCRADGDGALRCLGAIGATCLAGGAACAVPEQCCSGFCLPDGAGGLACRPACAPAGAPCVASGDCCERACVGPSGRAVCAAVAGSTPACLPAGAPCTAGQSSCCAGTSCEPTTAGTSACVMVIK